MRPWAGMNSRSMPICSCWRAAREPDAAVLAATPASGSPPARAPRRRTGAPPPRSRAAPRRHVVDAVDHDGSYGRRARERSPSGRRSSSSTGGSCGREPGADEPRLVELVGRQPGAQPRAAARRAARCRCARPAPPGRRKRRPSRRRGRRRSRTRRSGPRALGCGASTSRAPACAARSTPPRRPQQRLQAPAAALEPGGALEALRGGGPRIWRRRARAARCRRRAGRRTAQRGVEPLAVEVGVEVAQARRQAAAHLPVGRGVLAPREPRAAVAQPEQRVELLDELGGAARPRTGPTQTACPRGGLARDLEDREGDVEPAAQVDVAVGARLSPLPGGLSALISRFSSTSAPSSDSVAW